MSDVVWTIQKANGTLLGVQSSASECDDLISHFGEAGDKTVPLYRQPQTPLTDEEREAINDAALELDELTGEFIPEPVRCRLLRQAATLRGLLERTK